MVSLFSDKTMWPFRNEDERVWESGERDLLRPFPWELKLYYAIPPIQSMVKAAHHPISPVISHHHQYNIKQSNISHGLIIVVG